MLTGFERDAMIHAIGQTVEDYNNLLNQLNLPCVTKRSRSDFGFYLDFSSFISKLNDKRGVPLDGSFEAVAMHPNGEDAIFCIVYVRDGSPFLLECSSTGEWPEDDRHIVFYQSK